MNLINRSAGQALEQNGPKQSNRRPRAAGPPLPQYRLYFLDGVDALISHAHEFEAKDDSHAIRISQGWLEGRRAELWSGSRKIQSWGAKA